MMSLFVKRDLFRFLLAILIIILAMVMGALTFLAFDNAPSDSLFYPIEASLLFVQFAFSVSLIDQTVTQATNRVALTILYYIFIFSVNIFDDEFADSGHG